MNRQFVISDRRRRHKKRRVSFLSNRKSNEDSESEDEKVIGSYDQGQHVPVCAAPPLPRQVPKKQKIAVDENGDPLLKLPPPERNDANERYSEATLPRPSPESDSMFDNIPQGKDGVQRFDAQRRSACSLRTRRKY